VTSIQWDPNDSNIVATGSYDEFLRIWDERNLSKPIQEFACGGGVWRIKWINAVKKNQKNENLNSTESKLNIELNVVETNTNRKEPILALACMQGGARVLRLSEDYKTCLKRIENFGKNSEVTDNLLIYGIDVLHAQYIDSCDDVQCVLVTSSFYENYINTWDCVV
jgi:WD40 repeat protein